MAGEFVINTTERYTYGGITVGGLTNQIKTANQVVSISTIVPANAVNFEVDVAFPITGCQSMSMDSSADGVTLKTNSTSTPGDTVTITKNTVLHWDVSKPSATKWLTVAVTKFYFTTGTTEAQIRFAAGLDSTP